jgi:integrase
MAAPKIKIILYKSKPKSDGTYPLVLRITKDRIRKYIFTKYNVSEEQWDAVACKVTNKHPNSLRLNNLLNKKLAEAEDILIDMDREKKNLNSGQLKQKIKGELNGSVYALSIEYLKNKKSLGKINQYTSDKSKFAALREFLAYEGIGKDIQAKNETGEIVNVRDISISEVNISFVKRYKTFLEIQGKGETTVYHRLNAVRRLYNMAIEDELVDGKDYPFGKGKKKLQLKPGESLRIGLDEDELSALEAIEIIKNNSDLIDAIKEEVTFIRDVEARLSSLIDSRNAFIFSYSFAGMRVSDVCKARRSDFKNGRYYYVMGKNSKPVSIPVPEEVDSILKYYEKKDPDNEFVFPFLRDADFNDPEDLATKINTANQKINKDLKILTKVAGIKKKVSMHIARHTFGNHSKGEIPAEVLQILYRHSSITTTINYQKNWIHDKVDEGLLKIVNLRKRKQGKNSAA